MSTRTIDLILPTGLLADRPVPDTVPAGSLYPATDTQIIYRNNDLGTGWEDWLIVADFTPGTDAEEVRDIVAAALVGGAGVTVTVDDGANTVTLSASVDAEVVRDTIGAALVAGTGVTITVDDAANTVTIAAAGTDAETVRDLVGSTLVAGTNVTITVDDAANTVTIAAAGSSGGGLDEEGVRDTVAAALVAGSGVTITPNDTGDTITIAAAVPRTFRGEWTAEPLLAEYAFPAVIAAPVVPSQAGSGQAPVVVDSTTIAGSGTAPSAYAKAVQLQLTTYLNTAFSRITLDIAQVGQVGVVKAKFWTAVATSGGGAYFQLDVKKNGSTFLSRASNGAKTWLETEVVVDSDDVLVWDMHGTQGFNDAIVGQAGVAGIRLYGAAEPYLLGQYVTHLGRLWRSTTNNNATTPGSDASWVDAAAPYSPTLLLGAADAVPASTPVGTIIFRKGTMTPKWWDGDSEET